MCELVEPGKVIALRTPAEEKQSFYIVVVTEIKTAETDTFDAFQYFVVKENKYLLCQYLKIEAEMKTFIQYRKCSAPVLVLPGEILTPFVDIADDYKLGLDEKQWLCDMA